MKRNIYIQLIDIASDAIDTIIAGLFLMWCALADLIADSPRQNK